MNPRIQKLYDQCFVVLENQSPNTGFDFEKFAELIVTDVIDILTTYRTQMIFHDGFEHNCEHPINAIRKHFGAEK